VRFYAWYVEAMSVTLLSNVTELTVALATVVPSDPLAPIDKDALITGMVVVLLAAALLINSIVEKRGIPVPEAIVTVLVGLAGGALVQLAPDMSAAAIAKFEDDSIKDFMLILISPIIFAEGYGLESRKFFANFTRILVLAFLGTVVCAVITAAFVYYLPPLTGMSAFSFTVLECLTFGVLISATDPVTTLATFKQQGLVEKGLGHLYYTVLGESILNDAVALTLFQGLRGLINDGHSTINGDNIGKLALDFSIAWFGSLAIGVGCGMLAALLLKCARLGGGASEEDHFYFNVPELGVVLVMSYMPFLIPSAAGSPLSPIVSVMFAGITMRHYCHYNLTLMTRQVFLPIVELLANLCEMYAFLLLGLAVFMLKLDFSLPLILWGIVGCLVSRAVSVYVLNFVVNKTSQSPEMKMKEQHVVWFAGLRGVVALVCALRFPENATTTNRNVWMCTIMVITFSSMVLMGWPTGSFMRFLDLQPAEKDTLTGRDSTSRMQRMIENSPKLSSVSNALRKFLMTKDGFEERMSRGSGAPPMAHGDMERPSSLTRPAHATRQSHSRQSHATTQSRATWPTMLGPVAQRPSICNP